MTLLKLPADASRTATAPSTTRMHLSTSMVKSMWPGVSTKCNVWSLQGKDTAADWMVIPESNEQGRHESKGKIKYATQIATSHNFMNK